MKTRKKVARKGLQKDGQLGILIDVKKTPFISSAE
jgi:hypothetical protein